jgi:hypothetical protein
MKIHLMEMLKSTGGFLIAGLIIAIDFAGIQKLKAFLNPIATSFYIITI